MAGIPEPTGRQDTPIALTIAGSDSGGGAGIQADLKTFAALGVYGASAITALTAQNTRTVAAIHDVPAEFVAAQIGAVLDDLDVAAIKIGMLASAQIIEAVADALAGWRGPLVLDPVMVAKSGDALLREDAVAALKERLLPRADLLTPNLPEAARLLGCDRAEAITAMEEQGRCLIALGARAVLMKGGHAGGDRVTDLLITADEEVRRIEAPRIATPNTHGTGCTLSSAIAAHLARGFGLAEAVEGAHAYTHAAIEAADRLAVGSGHGPLHHFHGSWRA